MKKKGFKIIIFSNNYLFVSKVFRGMVVASSQAYGVDNVPAGSIIYLAVVIYSPVTAVFSFTGAAFGALIGNYL